ncbi:MAG: response regulator transcription factor [Bacteroidetes bacterium]|nr:response regulator transcription factor [Bacteroidota bacterium]
MKTKIFYIEDELYLGRIVKETLENQGYEVVWESDGARVMNHLGNYWPDICVLDIMLPHVDGYELCKQIKAVKPRLPVIFLTAKTETADLVRGFEAGGTDYIRKPFSMEEVMVRIENQLSLGQGTAPNSGSLREEIPLGKYTYHPSRYELVSPEGSLQLSQRESEILSQLAASVNRVIERKQLLISVWGDDSFFNSRNLDVYIRKIREYFKHDPNIRIQTLKGKGYLFLAPQDAPG